MCQLCGITTIADKDRWPKPVESSVRDATFLVSTVHEEVERAKTGTEGEGVAQTESLLDVLRLLADQLNQIEEQRVKWWTTPEKRELRKRLEQECDQKKLSALHLVNNKTSDMIESMVS